MSGEDPKTGEKSYSIDVAFRDLRTDPAIKKFHDTMLDNVILSKAEERSQEWFGNPMPSDVIAEFYRPLVKAPKDPRYSPTMKIKIPVSKQGVPTPEIYSETKEIGSPPCWNNLSNQIVFRCMQWGCKHYKN